MTNRLVRHFAHKVKNVDEISQLIQPRPRSLRVVMCHGVFDIVHPGHIRHLLYAHSKGDILVASVTADRHVTKRGGMPFVPEELRAANLAALEMVDYVLIDQNDAPLANIAKLQPDLFVKGFEYGASGIHPKTQEEMAVVQSYGGEFLFSPGDVVYSSTALLAYYRPDLSVDKLTTLMDAEGVGFDHLAAAAGGFEGIRVHVVGDTIVDKYSYCALLGPVPKSPTFSVRLERSERFVGGAGIVARHLRSLGAHVTFTTLLGDDPLKDFVLEDLARADITVEPIVERARPTTQKERFWAANHMMVQVDTVDNHPIQGAPLVSFQDALSATKADVIIFSDFRHGIFHSQSIPSLIQAMPEGALRVADSQVSNRWGNILEMQEFDLITPNEREARFAMGDQDSGVRHLAQLLHEKARCRYLILKMSERGVLTYRHAGAHTRDWFYLDSLAESVVDPTGAGDALLAASALVLQKTKSIVLAAILGSLAAGIACGIEGNVPITPAGLTQALQRIRDLAR